MRSTDAARPSRGSCASACYGSPRRARIHCAGHGLLRDAGLDVELVFFDAAQPIAVAAASGDIDIGVTAFTAGLFNLAGRGALAVIAGQSREGSGLSARCLSRDDAAERRVDAAPGHPGKRIGITQVGSSFHFAAGLLAEKYGFPISDVKFVPLQSMSQHRVGAEGGAVDGRFVARDRRGRGRFRRSAPSRLGRRRGSMATGAAFVSAKFKAEERQIAAFSRRLSSRLPRFTTPSMSGMRPQMRRRACWRSSASTRTSRRTWWRRRSPTSTPEGKLDVANVARQVAWYQGRVSSTRVRRRPVVDRRFVTER